MSKVIDADIRELALSPEQSFIVQAPAGSGKTELIMQRYLALLATVESPEEIIAITFTRKATAEMRGRILAALERSASDAEPELAHERKSWQLAQKALQRDAELKWNLLQNPNRLRIQTIDALSANLSRQMPILSRAGVNPLTTENADELYQQAARATLKELSRSEDVAFLLAHLDNNWQRLESLLIGLLQKRDHWLRHLPSSTDNHGLIQEREHLQESLAAIVEETLLKTSKKIPVEIKENWISLAIFAAENLEKEGKPHALLCCKNLQQWPTADPENLSVWEALIELVLTQKNEWRKSLTKTMGFPPPSSCKNPELKQLFTDRKIEVSAMIADLQDVSDLKHDLEEIRLLPKPIYSDSQWQVLQALFVVLKLAVAHLHLVFRDQGKVDFTEVSLAAIYALGDAEHPTDLALSLDYKIHHLLVDEFQDTSASQYTLLERMTSGWELNDGRSLFLVGDPMQSIYRFREADVGLFINVQQQQALGHVALTSLQLAVNFRSDAVVVNWINETFKKAMPRYSSVTNGAVSYTASRAFHDQADHAKVNLHPLIDSDRITEAELVCEQIRQAGDQSVAILVRNKSHLLDIIIALKKQALPYQAVEIENLAQRPAIQDLNALCRALLHMADKTAWLATLRAPWCGLRLDDLERLVGRSKQTVWSLINDPQRFIALSDEAQDRLLRLKIVIENALQQRRRVSLAAWLEDVWIKLGGPAGLHSESDLEDCQSFFELVDSFDDGAELASLDQLDQAIQGLFAAPMQSNTPLPQLMTIHKSKGLEFDYVIIPGLQRQPRNDDRQLLQWTEWRNTVQDRNELLLAPIEETGREKDRINLYLASLEKQRSQHEAVRLLYVACTRARRQLHLIGTAKRDKEGGLKKPDQRSLLMQIWPNVKQQFQQHAEISLAADQNNNPNQEVAKFQAYINRLPEHWQAPNAPEPLRWQSESVELADDHLPELEFIWAGAPAKYIGIAVHRILQQIAEQGNLLFESNDELIETLLLESGMPRSLLPDSIKKVQTAIQRTLEDDRGRWLLSDQHQQARNEFSLSGILDGELINVVIDRTFIDKSGTRWIIDYKTGSHKGGDLDSFLDNEELRYRPQLERYGGLVSKLGRHPIKLALYFPLLSAWRELQ